MHGYMKLLIKISSKVAKGNWASLEYFPFYLWEVHTCQQIASPLEDKSNALKMDDFQTNQP